MSKNVNSDVTMNPPIEVIETKIMWAYFLD